jgi:hypothetical protein
VEPDEEDDVDDEDEGEDEDDGAAAEEGAGLEVRTTGLSKNSAARKPTITSPFSSSIISLNDISPCVSRLNSPQMFPYSSILITTTCHINELPRLVTYNLSPTMYWVTEGADEDEAEEDEADEVDEEDKEEVEDEDWVCGSTFCQARPAQRLSLTYSG